MEEKWSHYPQDVGIVAMDIYFPRPYVDQAELEQFDGVSKGKYTIGLGQKGLAFCTDREDIYSISLSAVTNLMRKYQIDYKSIGRLEVATETILDHSKAVKTVLMQLFEESGNFDIEGIDSMNACYAGTNALFNSLAWVESSAWDGRFALVVAADIAEYAEGNARPTGGCGAVAFLIGPNAPIIVERGRRASYFEHAYDFYKPNLSSPYPVVDGKFSGICYLRALDRCVAGYRAKAQRLLGRPYAVTDADYVIFHSPYNKLVQKSFARMMYSDFLAFPDREEFAVPGLEAFRHVPLEESYTNVPLEKAFAGLSQSAYQAKVGPSTLLPQELGNMYTASLYASLLSLLCTTSPQDLLGRQILCFSYGSGLASSLFSLRIAQHERASSELAALQAHCNLERRLRSRTRVEPAVFSNMMKVRERLHEQGTGVPFQPESDVSGLLMWPGAHYLDHKDAQARRYFRRVPEVGR